MKACIFDLDGTLVNTLESLMYSVDLTLQEMELQPITKEQTRNFVGNGAKVLLEKALEASGGNPKKQLEEASLIYERVFDTYCNYHVKAYPGIKEVLLKLKQEGYKLGVLSNKPDKQAIKVVNSIFDKDLFDVVYGQKGQVKRKPNPEGLYKALEVLNVDKKNSIYIGDSEVDVATGLNAGIKTVAVAWGFRTEKELIEAGAKTIVHLPGELYQEIKK